MRTRAQRAYGIAEKPKPTWYIGLDLGKTRDPTAMAVAYRTPWSDLPEGERPKKTRGSGKDPWVYDVPILERMLDKKYPQIVRYVSETVRVLKADRAGEVHLIVDATGIGRGVIDMFEEAGMEPYAVTFTGGHEPSEGTHSERAWNVPVEDLVATAKIALQRGFLRVAKDQPLAGHLRRELEVFEAKIDKDTLHVSYEARRSGDSDDLVFAVCLITWAAHNEEMLVLGGHKWWRGIY